MSQPRPLHQNLVDAVALHPARTAIVEPEGGSISYQSLDELSDRVRDRLCASGLRPEHAVEHDDVTVCQAVDVGFGEQRVVVHGSPPTGSRNDGVPDRRSDGQIRVRRSSRHGSTAPLRRGTRHVFVLPFADRSRMSQRDAPSVVGANSPILDR